MKSALRTIGFALFASVVMVGSARSQQDKPPQDGTILRHRLETQLKMLEERRAMVVDRLDALDRGEPVEPLPKFDRANWHPQTVSAEEKQRLLAVLGTVDADDSGFDLRQFLSRDTDDSARMMRRIAPRLRKLAKLKDHDPELFHLQREELLAGIGIARAMRHLARLKRDGPANEYELEEASDQLKQAIGRGFEAKANLARLELKRAHDRYAALSDELEQAESHREQRINERFAEMLRHIDQAKNGPPHRDRPAPRRSGDD